MAYKKISILWATKIERGEKTFDEVPAQLKDEVEQKLIEDGFIINEDGTVTPASEQNN